MSHQSIARRYRPTRFCDVLGQDPIVQTLQHALAAATTAPAYLFAGPRGTGKTTLARLLAKALNCPHRTADQEPCCNCSACSAIARGTSLDLLEIDAASNRGIDDIRTITESVYYTPSVGPYKIYLIDEVHMLTKEAFNALLKTLEEPPSHVKFLFATTDPQKIPETVLSRCQRFNVRRIPLTLITTKLRRIAGDLSVTIDDQALQRLAQHAEGGLRDAESLLDLLVAYNATSIDCTTIEEVLGLLPQATFQALDEAYQRGDHAAIFRITNDLVLHGKDLMGFLHDLSAHYRSILHALLGCSHERSVPSASYTKEACLDILDLIATYEPLIRQSIAPHYALEALLQRIIRLRHAIPLENLVQRLIELEAQVRATPLATPLAIPTPTTAAAPAPTPPPPVAVQKTPRHDTLMQFAAVELEGTIQKRP